MAETFTDDRKLNTPAKLISVYIKENGKHTIERFKDILMTEGKLSDKDATKCVSLLRQYGVLRVAINKDEDDELETQEVSDVVYENSKDTEKDFKYEIPFVGIIVAGGFVIKCYPKYLVKYDTEKYSYPKDEFKEIINVLKKYNKTHEKRKDQSHLKLYDEKGTYNRLFLLLDILNDYFENGLYINTVNVSETNGPGEILWDRTINSNLALIYGRKPYYVNLTTRRHVKKEHDYFTRLHECVIKDVYTELERADLLDVFGIPKVNLSTENISSFGSDFEILHNIDKELGRQFNSRKRHVLGLLHIYLEEKNSLYDGDGFSYFGSFSFEYVWQEVCSCIFENKLEVPLKNLDLPAPLQAKYLKYGEEEDIVSLLDIIEKPFWSVTEKKADYSFVPDIISIKGDEFVIYDTKYCVPKLEKGWKPEKQPGIESVTKQYLYLLAYKEFIQDHKFNRVRNCFLIPSEKDNDEYMGFVSMDNIFSSFKYLFPEHHLENIKVIFLSARNCYRKYLSGEYVSFEDLPSV